MTRYNFLPHRAGTNNMQREVCLVLVSCYINAGQSLSFLRQTIFWNHIAIDSFNYQSPHAHFGFIFFFFFNFLLSLSNIISIYTGTCFYII